MFLLLIIDTNSTLLVIYKRINALIQIIPL